MEWGGIHLDGMTPLHLVHSNLTSVRYRDEIVRCFVLPTLQAMGPGAIFQDPNATSHCAPSCSSIRLPGYQDEMASPFP